MDEPTTPSVTPIADPPPGQAHVLQPAPPTPPAPDTQQVFGLLAELEDRLGRLKTWQSDTDEQFEQIRQHAANVQQRQAQAEALAAEARQQQEQIERERAQLASDREQLEHAAAEQTQRRRELDEQRETADAEREELAELRRQLEETKGQVSKDAHALDQKWGEFREREHHHHERDQALQNREAELGQETQTLRDRTAELEALQATLTEREETLASQQSQLDSLRDSLEEQRRETDAAQRTLTEERDRLTADQQQLVHQREALEHERTEAETLRHAAAKQRAEVELRIKELEARQVSLDRSREQLAELTAALPVDDPGELAEAHHRWVEAEANYRAELEATEALRAKLEHKQRELEERKGQFRQTLEAGKTQLGAERDRLERIAEELAAREAEVESKQRRHDGVAERQLQRRKARLHRYVGILREQRNALERERQAVESSSNQSTGLEKERQMLLEVKRFLESSETQMVRKWATHRAATIVCGMIVCVLLLAAVSLAAGFQAAQPVWQASMVLGWETKETTTSSAPPADEAETVIDASTRTAADEAWRARFAETLFSDPVMSASLDGLDQRGLRLVTSPAELRDLLRPGLRLEGNGEQIRLVYRSPDKERVALVLEAVGRAMLGFQLSQAWSGSQPDRVPAVVQAAGRLTDPVEDPRLATSGVIFGSLLGGGTLLFAVARVVLGRSRRVFDAEAAPELHTLDKPETWSPLRAA